MVTIFTYFTEKEIKMLCKKTKIYCSIERRCIWICSAFFTSFTKNQANFTIIKKFKKIYVIIALSKKDVCFLHNLFKCISWAFMFIIQVHSIIAYM